MFFEWDEHKNQSNIAKHNVSFDLASGIFEDENLLSEIDHHDISFEERWRAIGLTQHVLLTVIHTVENDYDKEIIRIISARKASQKEARRYCYYR